MGVLNIYNELGKAQFERLSAAPANLQGRFYYDIVLGYPYLNDGVGNYQFLLNRDPLIIGTNGTASNNVRLYATAPGTLTLLRGSETATPPVSPTNYANFTAFLLDCKVTTQLMFDQVTPTNPAVNVLAMYQKTDGYMYLRTSAGVEYPIIAKEVPTYLDWVQQGSTPANPASNRYRTYFKSDGYLYSLDSAGLERKIGSGSGGGINYDSNPDIEAAITGYVAYADAAGVAPVDGTGGSPSLTVTRTTSSPLRGIGSGLITKSASNLQGQGASYAFTIDTADRGRQITVSFDFQTDTNYVASDILMYVVDVTNGTVIQMAPAGLPKSDTLSSQFTCVFQTASNSVSYRLCWHVATTSALLYTVKFDNVSISPTDVIYAAGVTDFDASRTFTSNITTNVTLTARSRRVGDQLQVVGNFVFSGANTQGTPTIIFSGLTIDSTKIGNGSRFAAGSWAIRNASSGAITNGTVIASTASIGVDRVSFGESVNTATNTPYTVASGHEFAFEFSVPIVGWGSNLQVGSYDGRTVAARYTGTAMSGSFTAASNAVFNNRIFDTHGAYSTSTGSFTAPVAGFYRVSGLITISATATTNSSFVETVVYKNGSIYGRLGCDLAQLTTAGYTFNAATGSTIVQLEAGDTVSLRCNSTGTISAQAFNNNANVNFIDIELVPGRSTLSAGDTVAARFTFAGTATHNAGVVVTPTLLESSVGSGVLSGTNLVAPVAGRYRVTAQGTIAYATSIGFTIQPSLQSSGVDGTTSMEFGGSTPASPSTKGPFTVTTYFRLLAGQAVNLSIYNFNSAATSGQAIAGSMTFDRIGNY